MGFQPWKKLPGQGLLVLLNLFSAIALIFEGYNQGVLGTVSGTPGFIDMAQIGANGKVTDSTKQGGLAAVYYFGAMFGCFIGGWCGDRYGRKRGTLIGASLCLTGGALMSASQNADMFIVARVIAGLGIGFINVIIPPWVSELSQAHNRGSNFSLVFVANFLGIILAYWINFAVRETGTEFRWRFPLGIMCAPVILIVLTVAFLPDSPRWLIANGYDADAVVVLSKVRGDLPHDHPALVEEIEVLRAQVESSKRKRNSLYNMVTGRYSGSLHLGRRVWLGFWLQQIQQWTGILAIATWAGTLFSLAGFDAYKSAWLAGLVNTFGVVGTAAAVSNTSCVLRYKYTNYYRRHSLLIASDVSSL
jgi:MFS family permease